MKKVILLLCIFAGVLTASAQFTKQINPLPAEESAFGQIKFVPAAKNTAAATSYRSPQAEINVTAGNLGTILTSSQLQTTESLILKGTVDARDFKTMRDLMPALTMIDLSEVNIMYYAGTAGTMDADFIYPANTIPRGAFFNKQTLKNIVLPNSLTAIGRSGFYNTGITAITLPSGLEKIGYYAFGFCASLQDIIVPSSVNTIDSLSFRSCTSLKKITIPAAVSEIKYAAFYQSGLSEITLHEGITKIGELAFGYSQLGSINLPASVSYLGAACFAGANTLTFVHPDNISFSNDERGILYDKGKYMVFYCSPGITGDYTIPSTVDRINSYTFAQSQLSDIYMPNSVKYIMEAAFYKALRLSKITIPSGVTEIGKIAFYGSSNLTEIHANPATPVNLNPADSVFKYVDTLTCKLYVPIGSGDLYKNAPVWKSFQQIIEEPTGINNLTIKDFTIHPNPVEKGFYVEEHLDIEKITVLDIRGAVVLTLANRNNYVDINHLQRGAYIVLLENKREIYRGKLIKK